MRISDWSSDVCSSDLPVATVLVGCGTLRVGDIFVVGAESGKVRALIDDKGRQVKEAGPSVPVEVLGLSGVPGAGDPLSVVESEARRRAEIGSATGGERVCTYVLISVAALSLKKKNQIKT